MFFQEVFALKCEELQILAMAHCIHRAFPSRSSTARPAVMMSSGPHCDSRPAGMPSIRSTVRSPVGKTILVPQCSGIRMCLEVSTANTTVTSWSPSASLSRAHSGSVPNGSIDAELSRRAGSVKFVWVKGHAGNAGNEKVDDLARTYAGDCRSGVQEGYLPKEGWQSLLASEYAKGTDVPEDAQMLLDGKISTQEYHLGRGGESGEAGAEHESDGDNVAKRIRKPSLAELLAEPEGVPDYGETQSDTSSTTAMSVPTVPITTESDATVALSSNSAQAEDTQSGSSTRSVAEPAAPRLSPTALTASGTLRFTPPPSTSPTYDGRPRIIHGLVRVDGYVNGDGTITLDNAAFYTDKQG